MGKIKKILAAIYLLSSSAFGEVTNSTGSQITVEAISIPNVSVSDVDFGDYVIGESSLPPMQHITVTITNGAPSRSVGISVATSSISLRNESVATEKVVGVMFAPATPTVTLNESGSGTGDILVALQNYPLVAGRYVGTQTVIIQYD